jgi:hypothetical protein
VLDSLTALKCSSRVLQYAYMERKYVIKTFQKHILVMSGGRMYLPTFTSSQHSRLELPRYTRPLQPYASRLGFPAAFLVFLWLIYSPAPSPHLVLTSTSSYTVLPLRISTVIG